MPSSLFDGVTVHSSGFVVAVLIFAVAQAILAPFVFNVARKYASAILGGGGGGKPDMAQGGGTDAARMPEALRAIAEGLA